jgi:hypothetical protein
MEHAPLYTDSFALCEWLLGHFDDDTRHLPRRICWNALELQEFLNLALKDYRRIEHIELADERLQCLRTQLRLAHSLAYLDQAQLWHALEYAESIGRQIGGWLDKLEPG